MCYGCVRWFHPRVGVAISPPSHIFTMSANNDTPTALAIHRDDLADNGTNNSTTAASSENEIVLDALSYVEGLDPNYEHYALSLVEAELQLQQQQHHDGKDDVFHPFVRRSLGVASDDDNNSFAKRAPLAAAAYEAVVHKKRRQQQQQQHNPSEAGEVVDNTTASAAENDDNNLNAAAITKNIVINSSSTIEELQAAITQSKIQLEYQRLRYTNLELHSLFETPHKYNSYLSSLEQLYTNPTAVAVEQQRLVVDGINGTRMEEQSAYMNKLMGLQMKYGMLLDKNWKLGRALESLQLEVEGLEKQVVDA